MTHTDIMHGGKMKKSNYQKATKFINTTNKETLKNLLLDLIFYNPTSFIEDFIANEFNL